MCTTVFKEMEKNISRKWKDGKKKLFKVIV